MPSLTPADLQQRLVLSPEDKRVLYFIAGYTAAIFLLWNLPVLKHLLHPFKLVVVRRDSNGIHSIHSFISG